MVMVCGWVALGSESTTRGADVWGRRVQRSMISGCGRRPARLTRCRQSCMYVPDEEGIARRIGRRNQHGYLPIPRSATHRACEPW
jgi:hypothetical protein